MSVCKQTPRKNVQLVNRPSENTTYDSASKQFDDLSRCKVLFSKLTSQNISTSKFILEMSAYRGYANEKLERWKTQ